MKTLNALAFGYAGATISAIVMLLLGILGNFGIYSGAVAQMLEWHIFFSLSIVGIISGMIEGAITSFIFFYAFAAIYNIFVTRKKD